MGTIWESVNELGGKRWVVAAFLPALLFSAALGWVYLDLFVGWGNFVTWWESLSASLQILNFVIGILIVVAVAFTLDALGILLIRWAEGYWASDGWIGKFAENRRQVMLKRRDDAVNTFASLFPQKAAGKLNAVQLRDLETADEAQRHYPIDVNNIMPTQIGNILRAAEEHSRERYGLDPVVTWFHLYPNMDETLREALSASRTNLDLAVRLIFLAILFILIAVPAEFLYGKYFTGIVLLLITLFLLYLFHTWSVNAAKNYGELIRTAFDLYRFKLYETLRLALPSESGQQEIAAGHNVAKFLWRGSVKIKYKHPDSAEPEASLSYDDD